MKVTILKGRYQRNGVSGEGFFQVLFDWKDTYNNFGKTSTESGKGFIATFTAKRGKLHDDETVDTPSTRVIDPKNFMEGWRGDNFGEDINNELQRLMVANHTARSIYDVLKRISPELY